MYPKRWMSLVPVLVVLTPVAASPARADVGPSGNYSHSIPFEVPPFHEIAPGLGLAYDSNAGNGLVGLGWSLTGFSYIVRASPGRGAPRYDASDIYLLDGMELIPCAGPTTSASCRAGGTHSTRVDDFERIVFDSARAIWTITIKNGTRRIYELLPMVDAGVHYHWAITKVIDTHGNQVNYQYAREADDWVPSRVYYAKAGGLAYDKVEVLLHYQSRPDPLTAANGKGLATATRRLLTVEVRVVDRLARAYGLAYTESPGTGRSLLAGVTQFGSDAVIDPVTHVASGVSLPASTFAMDVGAGAAVHDRISPVQGRMPSLSFGATPAPARVFANTLWHLAPGGSPFLAGDFDGDGRDDVAQVVTPGGAAATVATIAVGRRAADGTTELSTTYVPWNMGDRSMFDPYGPPNPSGLLVNLGPGWFHVGDVDGDGDADIQMIGITQYDPDNLLGGQGHLVAKRLLSDGRGGFVGEAPYHYLDAPDPAHPLRCVVGDFTGDGAAELACDYAPLDSTLRGPRARFAPDHLGEPTSDDAELLVGDVDGDGHTELLAAEKHTACDAANPSICEHVALRVNGSTIDTVWPWRDGTWTTADVDGDGRTDFVQVAAAGSDGGAEIRVARLEGASWQFQTQAMAGLPSGALAIAGDIDGDARTDLFVLTSHGAHGVSSCSSARSDAHAVVHRLLSLGDGSFRVPAAWAACSPDSPDERHMTWTGSWIADQAVRAPDLNGDGLADLVFIHGYGSCTLPSCGRIDDDLSRPIGQDRQQWRAADVDGDGRQDFVYLMFTNPGVRTYVYRRLANGNYALHVQDVPAAAGRPLAEPDMRRWQTVDVGRPGAMPAPTADGKSDLVLIERTLDPTTGGGLRVTSLLSNGDGTFTPVTSEPWPGYQEPDPQHFAPAELDGDGRTDFVHTSAIPGGTRLDSLVSNGDGTFTTHQVDVQAGYYGYGSGVALCAVQDSCPYAWEIMSRPRRLLLDVDGDGRSDVVDVWTNQVTTYFGDGGGFRAVTGEVDLPAYAARFRSWRPADLNGDGMGDLVAVDPAGWIHTLISHGSGDWTARTVLAAPLANPPEPTSWRPDDVNRDGRTDLVSITSIPFGTTRRTRLIAVLNLPAGWTRVDLGDFPFFDRDTWKWRPIDPDGDGNRGYFYQGRMTFDEEFHVLDIHWPGERMVAADNGLGAVESIAYGVSTGHHAYLPVGGVLRTVASTTVTSAGASETTTYTFDGATWSDADNRLLGFGRMVVDAGARSTIDFEMTETCGARPRLTSLEDPARGVIQSSKTTYVLATATGQAPYTCLPYTRIVHECEGSTTCRDLGEEYRWDVYGNRVQHIEYGDLADPLDDRLTEAPPFPNPLAYVVGLPAYLNVYRLTETVQGNLWETVASTEYLYDGNGSWSKMPTVGELRSVRRWNDQTGGSLVSTMRYDATGNLTVAAVPPTAHNPAGAWETAAYDPDLEVYPARICNPLLCASRRWDPGLGQPLSYTDNNQQTTSFELDRFGRTTLTTHPDGAFERVSYRDFGTAAQRVVTEISDGSADGVLHQTRFFDGLGRTTRAERESQVTEIEYDGMSERPLRRSAPGWWGPGPFTDYQYDGIERLARIVHADGSSVAFTRLVGQQIVRDELGHTTTYRHDGFGRVVEVVEDNHECPLGRIDESCPATSYRTAYAYDVQDRLIDVTDALLNHSTAVWDSLGRRLRSCDPDLGCWTYRYHDDGALAEVTDSKGQRTTYTYDALARAIRQDSFDASGNPEDTVSFVYDIDPVTRAPRGASLGRLTLASATRSGATERRDYDARGRVVDVTRTVGGVSVELGFAYDAAGRVASVRYPDASGLLTAASEEVRHRYDEEGNLVSVGGYATGMQWTAADQLSEMQLGNGLVERTFYDGQRGWMERTKVGLNAILYEARYVHDTGGQITSVDMSNGAAPVTEGYGYDDLGRLVSASSTAHRPRTWGYDPVGNLTFNSDLGNYDYADPDHVHAVTDAGTMGAALTLYDANGNLERSPGRAIEYDVRNRPVSVVTTDASAAYQYGPFGDRVRRDDAAGTTLSFGSLVERSPAGNFVMSYYAGDRLIARRDGGQVTYIHGDHLGSPRMVTDSRGRVLSRIDHEPFGDTRGAGNLGFAGHQVDASVGLVYMGARYYDPALGRFLTADTMVPDLYDPQSLNRYSYVRNNPISRIDPSGHSDVDVCQTFDGGVCVGGGASPGGVVLSSAIGLFGSLLAQNATDRAAGTATPPAGPSSVEPPTRTFEEWQAKQNPNAFMTPESREAWSFIDFDEGVGRDFVDPFVLRVSQALRAVSFLGGNIAGAIGNAMLDKADGNMREAGLDDYDSAGGETGRALITVASFTPYRGPLMAMLGPPTPAMLRLRLSRSQFTADEIAAIEQKYARANGNTYWVNPRKGANVTYDGDASRAFAREFHPSFRNNRDIALSKVRIRKLDNGAIEVDEFIARQWGGPQVPGNQHFFDRALNSKLGGVEFQAGKHLDHGTTILGFEVQWLPRRRRRPVRHRERVRRWRHSCRGRSAAEVAP